MQIVSVSKFLEISTIELPLKRYTDKFNGKCFKQRICIQIFVKANLYLQLKIFRMNKKFNELFWVFF